MSTRGTILIKLKRNTQKGEEVTEKHLYKHHDSYLLGTGKALVEYTEQHLQEALYANSIDYFIYDLPRCFEDTEDVTKHSDREYHYDVEIENEEKDGENKISCRIYATNFTWDDDGNKLAKDRELIYRFDEYGTRLINLH